MHILPIFLIIRPITFVPTTITVHCVAMILSPGLLMIWLTGLSLLVVLLWRKNVNNPSAKMSKYPPGPR